MVHVALSALIGARLVIATDKNIYYFKNICRVMEDYLRLHWIDLRHRVRTFQEIDFCLLTL